MSVFVCILNVTLEIFLRNLKTTFNMETKGSVFPQFRNQTAIVEAKVGGLEKPLQILLLLFFFFNSNEILDFHQFCSGIILIPRSSSISQQLNYVFQPPQRSVIKLVSRLRNSPTDHGAKWKLACPHQLILNIEHTHRFYFGPGRHRDLTMKMNLKIFLFQLVLLQIFIQQIYFITCHSQDLARNLVPIAICMRPHHEVNVWLKQSRRPPLALQIMWESL